MTQGHISTVNGGGFGCQDVPPDADGLCHCRPRPESSACGECPQCHRLDPASVSENLRGAA